VYPVNFQIEPFEFEAELEGEVNRKSRDYIKWVQQSLNQIMGLRLDVDGIVGTQTRSAIRSFQKSQGLEVDGIVGAKTEAALRNTLGKHPTPATQPAPAQSAAQSPSTTSGVEAAGNTTRIIQCIQGLQAQGRSISFVVRYLRDLKRAEAVALSSAGLKIVSCYELSSAAGVSPTNMAYFTRAQGEHDGRLGFTQAQAVGQPSETPVYFAVDTDPNGNQRQPILNYFQGIQDGYNQYLADMQAQNKPAVAYAIGVYGSGCVLNWCQAQGIATWFWQAFAPGWCNNRQVWPGANIHTSGGDKPERCGWRLARLEGWGNEGGW